MRALAALVVVTAANAMRQRRGIATSQRHGQCRPLAFGAPLSLAGSDARGAGSPSRRREHTNEGRGEKRKKRPEAAAVFGLPGGLWGALRSWRSLSVKPM